MKSTLVTLIVLLSSGMVGCVSQSSGLYDGATTVTVENDTFTGSDSNYTNGLGVSWVSNDLDTYDPDSFVPRWGKFWSFLPFVSNDGYDTYASWSVAQEMHTPDDITDPNPPLDDQPYAGVLYLDNTLYALGERWRHAWNLRTGVVGPDSQAEDVQKKYHEWTNSDEPMGWDTQLPNEAILNVDYSASYLLAQGKMGKSAGWRIVPAFTAGLGNYFTGAGGGIYGEVGWNLVGAPGGAALRSGLNAASTVGVGPVEGWSVSFSGGYAGYGIVHYLPLDGTVSRDSRSVETESYIGMTTFGISMRHRGLVLSLLATFYDDTFATERESPEFGTFNVSWFF